MAVPLVLISRYDRTSPPLSHLRVKEIEGLRSEVRRLTTVSTYAVMNEREVGRNLIQKSTVHSFDNLLASLPGSLTVSSELQGTVLVWSGIFCFFFRHLLHFGPNIKMLSPVDAIRVAREALKVARNEQDVQRGLMPLFLSLKREFKSDFFVQDTSAQAALKNPMAKPDVSITYQNMVSHSDV